MQTGPTISRKRVEASRSGRRKQIPTLLDVSIVSVLRGTGCVQARCVLQSGPRKLRQGGGLAKFTLVARTDVKDFCRYNYEAEARGGWDGLFGVSRTETGAKSGSPPRPSPACYRSATTIDYGAARNTNTTALFAKRAWRIFQRHAAISPIIAAD